MIKSKLRDMRALCDRGIDEDTSRNPACSELQVRIKEYMESVLHDEHVLGRMPTLKEWKYRSRGWKWRPQSLKDIDYYVMIYNRLSDGRDRRLENMIEITNKFIEKNNRQSRIIACQQLTIQATNELARLRVDPDREEA